MEKPIYTSVCTSCGLTANGYFSRCMGCGGRRMNQLRHKKDAHLPSELTLAQGRAPQSLVSLVLVAVVVVAFVTWYTQVTGQQSAVVLTLQRMRINLTASGRQIAGMCDTAMNKKIAQRSTQVAN